MIVVLFENSITKERKQTNFRLAELKIKILNEKNFWNDLITNWCTQKKTGKKNLR